MTTSQTLGNFDPDTVKAVPDDPLLGALGAIHGIERVGRVAELACAIVARIAPGFDPSEVMPPLVMRAVEAAQAEQFLLIRVHPAVRDKVQAGLGAVRQAHPAVGVIELVDDESLDALSCVVVSEAGEVRAGIAQQIEAIRAALAGVNVPLAPDA